MRYISSYLEIALSLLLIIIVIISLYSSGVSLGLGIVLFLLLTYLGMSIIFAFTNFLEAFSLKEIALFIIGAVVFLGLMPYLTKMLFNYFVPNESFSNLTYFCSGVILFFVLAFVVVWISEWRVRIKAIKIFKTKLSLDPLATKEKFKIFAKEQDDLFDFRGTRFKQDTLKNIGQIEFDKLVAKNEEKINSLAEELYGQKYYDQKLTRMIKKIINQENEK